MRYLIAFAVVIMLFVLPAGSWWYLQSGFNYRKQILEDIKPKRALAQQGEDEKGMMAVEKVFKDKITVFASGTNIDSKKQDIIDRIAEKYGNRDYFQFKTMRELQSELSQGDLSTHRDSIYLIDKDLLIRNAYSWSDEDVKKLVEHTAALLPVPKREKISLKRDLENEAKEK